jgi:hypothetical protein
VVRVRAKALAAVVAEGWGEGWAKEWDEAKGKVEGRVGEAWARDAAEVVGWGPRVTPVNILDALKNHA